MTDETLRETLDTATSSAVMRGVSLDDIEHELRTALKRVERLQEGGQE